MVVLNKSKKTQKKKQENFFPGKIKNISGRFGDFIALGMKYDEMEQFVNSGGYLNINIFQKEDGSFYGVIDDFDPVYNNRGYTKKETKEEIQEVKQDLNGMEQMMEMFKMFSQMQDIKK